MDICDSGHGDKRQVVQKPADDGVDAGVVEVVDIALGEVVVAALPAYAVPDDHQTEDGEGCGTAPVDEGVAEEEVLDDVVVPAAHAEADVEEWPLPWGGGEVVLFVWVGDEGVVGCHHCDVEVDKVTEER